MRANRSIDRLVGIDKRVFAFTNLLCRAHSPDSENTPLRIMKIIVHAIALALAIASNAHATNAAAQCSIAPNTLLFDDCPKTCQASAPCIKSAGADCKLECLKPFIDMKDGSQEFWLLVPFGKWKSSQELAAKTPLPPSEKDSYVMAAMKSNDELTKIAQMKLPTIATKVYVSYRSDSCKYSIRTSSRAL